MKLLDDDILTREVCGWKGIHLFHFTQSSCSQKLRIFLDLKGVPWEPHHIDLMANENIGPWFLGINPRGLVPVLVHDGAVHIESNDILAYLDELYPTPRLVPPGKAAQVGDLLKHEDDLHFDLRNLSFRFVFAPPEPPKSPEVLSVYASAGSGSVGGAPDHGLADQIDYWERYAAAGGIPDSVARVSAQRFKKAFDDLDASLEHHSFLAGDSLTVVDIAWFIYVDRLNHAGYPFARLHPRLAAWFERLSLVPAFARELDVSAKLTGHLEEVRRSQGASTLETVAGF